MLDKINAAGSHHLSKPWRRGISHCFRRYYYQPRHDATPSSLARDKNATDTSRPSSNLPLPPILDSETVDARLRLVNKHPKPLQDTANLTDFQRRLASNPYANVLATPIRQCYLTGARLPRHFLLTFNTEFHSKEQPYGAVKLAPSIALQTEASTPGQKTSVIGKMSFVRALGKKNAWHRLINKDTHDKYRVKHKKEWSYPDDMESQILAHLRRSAFQKLKWAFDKPSAKLIRPFEMSNNGFANISCVLQLRGHEASLPLNELPTPVSDLRVLLGEDMLKELVEGTTFADTHSVSLAYSNLTVAAQIRLSRLQTFVEG